MTLTIWQRLAHLVAFWNKLRNTKGVSCSHWLGAEILWLDGSPWSSNPGFIRVFLDVTLKFPTTSAEQVTRDIRKPQLRWSRDSKTRFLRKYGLFFKSLSTVDRLQWDYQGAEYLSKHTNNETFSPTKTQTTHRTQACNIWSGLIFLSEFWK